MPLFRFHLVCPDDRLVDEDGLDCADAQDAAEGAAALVAEIRRDPAAHAQWRAWTIEIADEDGRVVATIPFA